MGSADNHPTARALWLALVVVSLRGAVPVAAQDIPLSCGVPLARHLDPGTVDLYRIVAAADAVAVVDAVDTSGTIGLLKLASEEEDATCSGTLLLSDPSGAAVRVSDCIGADSGAYTITANVVTDGPDNCGVPFPCGSTPYVRHLKVPGEVDAYTFSGIKGDQVTLAASDVGGSLGSVRLRIFDPHGEPASGADSCASAPRTLRLQSTGTYTALVSACGLPKAGLYGITFESASCAAGPDITYFGVARADGTARTPSGYDDAGRPLYAVTGGDGLFLVVEARPGPSGAPVGRQAFMYAQGDPTVLPDLQMLVSRSLGDGNPVVCDKVRPNQGGVPGERPLEFTGTQAVADAINDLGCRVNDGAGQPQGISDPSEACTAFNGGSDFHFVDSDSTLQFCTPIAQAWSFPRGTTIVKARVRDTADFVGPAREIAIQVGPVRCPGDCNDDFEVTVDELLTGSNIALGRATIDACPAMDANGDGRVTVDDLMAATVNTLYGCEGL